MPNIAGVRLREAGKITYYDAGDLEVHVSDYVVVDSSHGVTVGRVVVAPDQVIANEFKDEVKPILRIATQEDVEKIEALREKAKEDGARVRKAIADSGLEMTLASGEYDLGGEHFTAYFTAPERVDFRNLVRDLSREIGARVQFVQIGDRDRAKLVDGVDICGERLCCASWMTSFPSVSIRMAKEQDLPLNPQKISGVCGRLYCCLTFEYDDYKALRGTLPKVGSLVSTPVGEAKVTGIDFMRERVKLFLTEQHTAVELAIVDMQLQHGVTVRPMELVRKVEGPMRRISEDRGSPPARRPQQPQRDRSARPADSETEQQIAEALRTDGRRPRRGRRGGEAAPPETQPSPQGAVEAGPPSAEASAGEGGQRRRRRRRRRGRGGGGQAGPAP
jgi:cell fate regulator YaaT (PSP1 superfamily)